MIFFVPSLTLPAQRETSTTKGYCTKSSSGPLLARTRRQVPNPLQHGAFWRVNIIQFEHFYVSRTDSLSFSKQIGTCHSNILINWINFICWIIMLTKEKSSLWLYNTVFARFGAEFRAARSFWKKNIADLADFNQKSISLFCWTCCFRENWKVAVKAKTRKMTCWYFQSK